MNFYETTPGTSSTLTNGTNTEPIVKRKPKPKTPLTRRQTRVLDWITKYISKHRWAPTVREIGRGMRISSPSGVMCHLRALERKGWIVRSPRESRAMYVVEDAHVEREGGGA